MARRRRNSRRATRVFPRVFRRSRSRSRGMSRGGTMAAVGGAMVYGALRQRVSDGLVPVTSRFAGFAGTLADEAVMGVLSYLLATKTSGFFQKVGQAGLMIESARAGEALSMGSIASPQAAQGTFLQNTLG